MAAHLAYRHCIGDATLLLPVKNVVNQRVDVLLGDVRIRGDIATVREGRAWVKSRGRSSGEVVDDRIGGANAFQVSVDIPGFVEKLEFRTTSACSRSPFRPNLREGAGDDRTAGA